MFAYISQNADNKIIEALKKEGFKVLPLVPCSALSHPVDTHADMLLLAVGDTVFVHKDYNIDLSHFNTVIKIDEKIGSKYPNDVLLNIAIVGKNVFANTKNASKTVLNYLKENGFIIHHVNQGYAHCSTCIVSDNAIISADTGIIEAAKNIGIDTLKINEGYISLPPYNHGFIGGVCGAYRENLYLCGSLNHHPDGEKIREFCLKHGKKIIEICDSPLNDVGGIIFR